MSIPFTNASGSTSDGRKRPGMVDDDASCSLVKRARCNYHYVLASESSQSEEEGRESVHSIQAKETDYCKDTTDTDTKSEVMFEYEVVSSSDNAWLLRAAVSSSGEDVLLAPRAMANSKGNESNKDIWATGDEDDDETASVTSLSAAQMFGCQICRMCKIRETSNSFNLCTVCYQIRKTAYPPRPRRKRKEKPSKAVPMQATAIASDSFNLAASQDSGASCSSLLDPLPQEPISSNCYLAAHPTLAAWASAAREMCIMCNAQPKNGIFVHTTGGHMCCCYACAVKFWSKAKRCAWCNLKARNVIKGFIG